jgi:DHA2 family multidrug resistance protein-like MFS transporter
MKKTTPEAVFAEGFASADLIEDDRRSPLVERDTDSGLQGRRRAVAIGSALGAGVLVVLDGAIANVALPTIARSLHVTPASSVLVITVYQMAIVMALLPCAALGESLGYRRVFISGVALFTAASALCALSPTLPWLVAARFLQGLGAAAVMALGVALLRFIVPPSRLGAAIGWNALTVALSSAAGPSIGAVILSWGSWPWLFAVNLPLGAAVLLARGALPRVQGTCRSIDTLSVALNAGGLAALIVGAELLSTKTSLAATLLLVGALALAALVRRELPKAAPLIPLDLLRAASFRSSVIASVCCFTGQAAAMVALPFYLQHGLHQNALKTGFYITPWPLCVAVSATVAGRISDRISTAWLCAFGGACLATGLAAAALWPLHGDPMKLVPMVMLCGVGFGFFQVPNNRNMFLAAPRARSGAAGGLQGTARLTGQTAGAVVMTVLFTLVSLDQAPRIGLAIAAVLTLLAGLVSLLRGARLPQQPKTGSLFRTAPKAFSAEVDTRSAKK